MYWYPAALFCHALSAINNYKYYPIKVTLDPHFKLSHLMGLPLSPLFKTCYKLRTNTFSLFYISLSLLSLPFYSDKKIKTAILFVSDLKLTLYMFYRKKTDSFSMAFTHSPFTLNHWISPYILNITSIGEARKEERFNQKR